MIKLALQVLEKNASWIQLLLQERTALRVEKHFGDVHRNRKQRGKIKSPLPPTALLPTTRVPICIIISCQVDREWIPYKTTNRVSCSIRGSFLVAHLVKSPPVMQKTQDRSLGQEDPLEKEMAIHSSILAWRIPWKEKPGRLQSMGSQRARHD